MPLAIRRSPAIVVIRYEGPRGGPGNAETLGVTWRHWLRKRLSWKALRLSQTASQF